MLEKISIRQFQCHEELQIELDQITVLTGASDVGKTAVLRALRWLCTNRPAGDAFRRHGEKSVSVRLRVDGHTVKRSKGNGGNLFKLDNKQYNAFGADVPEEIQKLLNVTEDNFARQLDAPFWFSLSPGEVSKRLNTIVNLDLIDRTLANLASESRKAKVTAEVVEGRLKDAREKRKGLAWVEEADEALSRVELELNKLKLVRNKRTEIAEAIEKLIDIESNRDRLLGAGLAIAKVLEAGYRAVEIGGKVESLGKLIRSLESAEESAVRFRQEAKEVETRLKREMGKECPLCERPFERKPLAV